VYCVCRFVAGSLPLASLGLPDFTLQFYSESKIPTQTKA
jgi:hypothetical protein